MKKNKIWSLGNLVPMSLMAFILVLACSSLTACGGDDDDDAGRPESLVDDWDIVSIDGEVFPFFVYQWGAMTIDKNYVMKIAFKYQQDTLDEYENNHPDAPKMSADTWYTASTYRLTITEGDAMSGSFTYAPVSSSSKVPKKKMGDVISRDGTYSISGYHLTLTLTEHYEGSYTYTSVYHCTPAKKLRFYDPPAEFHYN